jgi:CheY-like chemotaxis protein
VDNLGLSLASLDLSALVSSVLAPAKAVATRFGVVLRVTPPRRPVLAWLDLTLARQALIGVLSTLIAARPDQVELNWRDAGGQAVLRVSVRPPLPAGASAEATERAQRLAAADDLLRAQGGGLRQESGESGLLSVDLTLRRAGGAAILLIDDNERVLRLFERYLLTGGFSVSSATSADAALDIISHERPDAIVLDIMMRDVDGWQLLQRLRAIPELAAVPIIVCSVLTEPEVAFALGAQVYLKKPVSQQEMLAALRQALGESSSEARRPAVP